MDAERERFVAVEERLHVKAVTLSPTVTEDDVVLPQGAAQRPRRVVLNGPEGCHLSDAGTENLAERR